MTKDLPQDVIERFRRFDAHVPSSDDPTLVVLKGGLPEGAMSIDPEELREQVMASREHLKQFVVK